MIAGAYITDIDDDGCERSYVMYFNIYIVIFIRQFIFFYSLFLLWFKGHVNNILFCHSQFDCGIWQDEEWSLALYSTFAHILVFLLRYRRDFGFSSSLVIPERPVLYLVPVWNLEWALVGKPESSWYLIWACVSGFVSLELSISIEVLMLSLLPMKRRLAKTSNYRRFVYWFCLFIYLWVLTFPL